jgi:hypothetical protein
VIKKTTRMMNRESGMGSYEHFYPMLVSVKRNKMWTQQQWVDKLNEAKITAHVVIGDIRTTLERKDIPRERCWGAIYKCLDLLKAFELVMEDASVTNGWTTDPRVLIERLVKGIQEIDELELASFPLQLALLDNDLEELISY